MPSNTQFYVNNHFPLDSNSHSSYTCNAVNQKYLEVPCRNMWSNGKLCPTISSSWKVGMGIQKWQVVPCPFTKTCQWLKLKSAWRQMLVCEGISWATTELQILKQDLNIHKIAAKVVPHYFSEVQPVDTLWETLYESGTCSLQIE